ncbi:MAG: FecR family protein [Bdellovibrionota bacterium]
MSLAETKAWEAREQDLASHSRAILPTINGSSPEPVSRIYLFQFPIYNTAARMDRERQLFNVTMQEHIRHEQLNNPWLRRVLLTIFFTVLVGALYAYPPEIVESSVPYQKLGLIRRNAVAKMKFAADGVRSQSRTPEKVWLEADFSLQSLLTWLRDAWKIKMDKALWQATMARQMQSLEERNVRLSKGGLQLGPSDGIVLVVRGEVKTGNGKNLQAEEVVRQNSVVSTGAKSFVKIWLADGSTFSLGAESSMRLSPVKAQEPLLLDLLLGTIRAKVIKSQVMGADGKPKEKLFIRTKTAAMGIRGTDFYVSLSPQSEATTLITFEGLVAFSKRMNQNESPAESLAASSVKQVGLGYFSEVREDTAAPSFPSAVPPARLEQLKASSDITGPVELELQEKILRNIDALDRSGLLLYRGNSRAAEYDELSDEQVEEIAAPVARKNRVAPKVEDYVGVSKPPPELENEKREFPDP